MYIDIHAHINNDKLYEDCEEVVERAKKCKVEKIVNASYDRKSIERALLLAERFDGVYATLGVHPHSAFEYDEETEELMLKNKDNKKVIAIGEIGLDYYDLETQIAYIKEHNPEIETLTEEIVKQKQKEIFIKQIELAKKMELPIVVHSRDATAETLEIIKANKENLKLGGLIHCFSGSTEIAKEYFKIGFYISVGGSITFKNARYIPEVVRQTGIDKVILETDCPYLSPEPYRGKTNEPKNVAIVAEKIADILDLPYSEVEKITTNNALKLFSRLR